MTTATPSNGSNWPAKVPTPPSPTKPRRPTTTSRPNFALFRTTVWIYPFFSTRWHDVFGYGQMKTELKLGRLPIRPYLSIRFDGDLNGTIGPTAGTPIRNICRKAPSSLPSASPPCPGTVLHGWFEAGESVNYLPSRTDEGAMIPDYRGGISGAKGFGHLMNSSKGFYFETNDDAVFVSRFQDDLLFLFAKPRRLHLRSARKASAACKRSFIGTGMPPPTGCTNIGPTTPKPAPACAFVSAICRSPCFSR